MHTPDEIDRVLVQFGRNAARMAENMTEEETAEYLTDFLRMAIGELAGIRLPRPKGFEIPTVLN
jgi:hypothetical protein